MYNAVVVTIIILAVIAVFLFVKGEPYERGDDDGKYDHE